MDQAPFALEAQNDRKANGQTDSVRSLITPKEWLGFKFLFSPRDFGLVSVDGVVLTKEI